MKAGPAVFGETISKITSGRRQATANGEDSKGYFDGLTEFGTPVAFRFFEEIQIAGPNREEGITEKRQLSIILEQKSTAQGKPQKQVDR